MTTYLIIFALFIFLLLIYRFIIFRLRIINRRHIEHTWIEWIKCAYNRVFIITTILMCILFALSTIIILTLT